MDALIRKYDIKLPTWRDLNVYMKDPEIVGLESSFLFLTVANVFLVYRVLTDVAPCPVFLTWWQVSQGLLMAWIAGYVGGEFKKLEYFPPISLDKKLLKELLYPTISYLLMLVLGNVVVANVSSIAAYPIIVTFTVVLHHVTRFAGCAEDYQKLRWISISALALGFLIGCTDRTTVSLSVLPWALLYGITSAIFRGCYLQKVMHTVEGKGNTLHNHQHAIGVALLPILIILTGEFRAFSYLPIIPTSLYDAQLWGCMIVIGCLPFLKNVISNRLIRKTGQGPWRALEVIAILLIFLLGCIFCETTPGWRGWFAIIFVACGRTVGMYDVLINESAGASRAAPAPLPKPAVEPVVARQATFEPVAESDTSGVEYTELPEQDAASPSENEI